MIQREIEIGQRSTSIESIRYFNPQLHEEEEEKNRLGFIHDKF
jgi:hypothetical protein